MNEAGRGPIVVGVRLSPSGRVRYFDAGDVELEVGDRVMVETDEGPREARVIIAPGQVLYSEIQGPLAPMLGKVAPD
jgi:cell fate regulator YaaT (PSP1 superfamily)